MWPEGPDRFEALFSNHVDLSRPAAVRYRDRIEASRERVDVGGVCEWERIDVPAVRYRDYSPGRFDEHGAIDSERVRSAHVGKVLGEAYVRHRIQGTTGAVRFRELERLLEDYARRNVEALIRLARRLAGQ